ncbi:uncharacterized protein FFMR_13614 [Fusarium fujikuroi]|nr:uncharacterized protein FFMR_13614 [Fusarium fujikuroi]
MPLIIKRKF